MISGGEVAMDLIATLKGGDFAVEGGSGLVNLGAKGLFSGGKVASRQARS